MVLQTLEMLKKCFSDDYLFDQMFFDGMKASEVVNWSRMMNAVAGQQHQKLMKTLIKLKKC